MQTEPAARSLETAYVIRPGTVTDFGFIAQSWAREFRDSSKQMKQVNPELFNRHCYPRIARILETAEVRVAGPKADGLTIYGYAVFQPGLVHMVYVRLPWRKLGIAKALLSGKDLRRLDWSTETRSFVGWIRHRYEFKGHRPFWMVETETAPHATASRSA